MDKIYDERELQIRVGQAINLACGELQAKIAQSEGYKRITTDVVSELVVEKYLPMISQIQDRCVNLHRKMNKILSPEEKLKQQLKAKETGPTKTKLTGIKTDKGTDVVNKDSNNDNDNNQPIYSVDNIEV